jgi:hypothetical protein
MSRMAATCSNCGKELGFFRRLTRGTGGLCADCAARHKEAQQKAQQDYRSLVASLSDGASLPEALPRIKQLEAKAEFSAHELQEINATALRSYAETALADDLLTADEEHAFSDVAKALGYDQDAIDTQHRDLIQRMVVAKVNDGRLPEIDDPDLITKGSEVVHAEVPAALLKEVVKRETRAGYGGVSFRVAKGVRFHAGGARGHSVVTGKEIQVAEYGVLSVSSKRVVFAGERSTIEILYTKLVGLNVFEDGVQLHASNRKNAPVFRLEAAEATAATINAAAQRV